MQEVKQQTKKQIAMSRKEARQNRIIFLSIGGLALLVVLILAFGAVEELLLKPTQPVAIVNGTKIRTDEYQDMVTYQRYNQYVTLGNLQQMVTDLQASPEENDFLIQFYEQQLGQLQSQLAMLPQSALEDMIDGELIRQRAEELGITVTDQDVQQRVDEDLRSALTQQPTEPISGTEELPTPAPVSQEQVDELYKTYLGNIQIPEKSFRAIIQREMLREKVQEAMADEVVTTGLVANVQIIQTETEEEALAAKERIKGGEEFAVVAGEVSTDTMTAEDGGSLGWVTTEQLSPRYGQAVEDLVFSMPVGDLETVESDGMFYVIQVLERDENGPLPEQVLANRRSMALSDWLVETKASPDTEIERLLDPDQIPPDPFSR